MSYTSAGTCWFSYYWVEQHHSNEEYRKHKLDWGLPMLNGKTSFPVSWVGWEKLHIWASKDFETENFKSLTSTDYHSVFTCYAAKNVTSQGYWTPIINMQMWHVSYSVCSMWYFRIIDKFVNFTVVLSWYKTDFWLHIQRAGA